MSERERYRQNKEKWQYAAVYRIPHEDMQAIRRYAKKNKDSINETILKYIAWGLETEEMAKTDTK